MTGEAVPSIPEKAESTDRVEGLSDGIFGVALTLLVLDIRVPEAAHGASEVTAALAELLPRVGIYIASFLIVGYTWIWHHLTFAMIERSTRVLLWVNLILLLAIGFLPFSTAVMARYPDARAAALTYGANLLWFSIMLNLLLAYAVRENLVSEKLDRETIDAAVYRGYLQTGLTAVAIVATVIYPYAGIAGFILIPVFYIATGAKNLLVRPSWR